MNGGGQVRGAGAKGRGNKVHLDHQACALPVAGDQRVGNALRGRNGRKRRRRQAFARVFPRRPALRVTGARRIIGLLLAAQKQCGCTLCLWSSQW